MIFGLDLFLPYGDTELFPHFFAFIISTPHLRHSARPHTHIRIIYITVTATATATATAQ